MKKIFIPFLIITLCFSVFAETQTFSGSIGNDSDINADYRETGVSRALSELIPGINGKNKFEKVRDFLDSNSYLPAEIVDEVRRTIKLTPEGEVNPIHNVLDERVDLDSRKRTLTKHLENVMQNLSDSEKIRIRPNDNYSKLKNNIDNLDESLRTGIRASDSNTLQSIAEYVVNKSKGYTAQNIAPIVMRAKEQLMSEDGKNLGETEQVMGRLFNSFEKGLETINNVRKSDPVVEEASTDLRTGDILEDNIGKIDEIIKPMTSIGTEDENIDEDGDPVYDIVNYVSRMNGEAPQALALNKKIHMNVMLDLMKENLKTNNTLDHEGEKVSPGGSGGFMKFLEIVTNIVSVISNILFNEENSFSGLANFFNGLPGAGGSADVTSPAFSSSSSSGGMTSGDASGASMGTKTGTLTGPGLQRIVQSALGAENKSDVIYGIDCYTATTEYGNLACAAVVSAILRNARAGLNQQVLYCPTLINTLAGLGYRKQSYPSQSQFTAGDVVFWAKSRSGRARHVGVIVAKDTYGKWWAIDNSSSRKRVLKRPVIRSYYPYVKCVLTYNQ